jgi:glutamyl-tRNA synthetase
MTVRVRFAPSPTGYLHVGGARTALFNYLFARQNGGVFILRIEDTDRERHTPQAIATIIEGLQWIGIDWDEGPFYQSETLAEHKEWAHRLVREGKAYRCFATTEELAEQRKALEAEKRAWRFDPRWRDLPLAESDRLAEEGKRFTVRFKSPQEPGSIVFEDLIYGRVEKRHEELEDFALLRPDGWPLYNLSVVIDDIRMGISHIIRGQDHINNTPKQILLYRAFGHEPPAFAHLPLIMASDRSKLSKRKHGEVVSVTTYRDRGFLPEAFFNFMALLGWNPGTEQEIFSKEELVKVFDIRRTNKSNAVFNFSEKDPQEWTDKKALWMNAQWMSRVPLARILPEAKADLVKAGLWDDAFEGEKREWFEFTVDTLRSRLHNLHEFAELGQPYFTDDFPVDDSTLQKKVLPHRDALKALLPEAAALLAEDAAFTLESLEKALREFAEARQVKLGVLNAGLRLAMTGQSAGPGIFHVVIMVGKERLRSRVARFVERFLAG